MKLMLIKSVIVLPVLFITIILYAIRGPLYESMQKENKKTSKSKTTPWPKILKDKNGFIVFTSNRDENWEIYKWEFGKQKPARLTNNPVSDIQPEISSNGKFIVFTRENKNGSDIYRMKTNGLKQKLLVKNGWEPGLSQDGKWLYFGREYNGRSAIYGKNLETGEEKQLIPELNKSFSGVSNNTPKPSPDGKTLTFFSKKGGHRIMCIDIDGENPRVLGSGCLPNFSPDGKWVAWTSSRGKSGTSIGVNSPDGKNAGTLSDLGFPRGHEYYPNFSNNARFLVFAICPDGQHNHERSNYQIYVKKIGKQNAYRITNNEYTDRAPDIYIFKKSKKDKKKKKSVTK
ncbi:MAG: DUF5050 domain-containing protein [Candidatus Theseobacter exili]|nr:DUF5050 domain-containing protein [Candidatus Theseobacter exili]